MPLDYTSAISEEVYIDDPRTGLRIVPSRDNKITDFARKLLTDFYLTKGESIQEAYARASRAWCGGDLELAQRLYEHVSHGDFMFASPVLSNAPLPGQKVKGMPVSCFLTYTPDSLEGLIDHSVETRWLAVLGGGVGGHWSDVRAVSDKAPGPIPFIHTVDADMEAYKQGKVRRGSYAAYMDVSHPDIVEFTNIRVPTGDASRKCNSTGFHHGVNITDEFMHAVVQDSSWNLIDPHNKEVRETIQARVLWEQILETRYRTGEPYICFIDEANRKLPQTQKDLGLRINGSNLCTEIFEATNEQRTAVCCLSSLNAENYDNWKDTSLVQDLIRMLDNVITYFINNAPAPLAKAAFSASQERALGLGLMGFHSYLQKHMIRFESSEARKINTDLFAYIKSEADKATFKLAEEFGESPDMIGTGRRNSMLLALAPNANSSILLGTSPSIEPNSANAYNHQTRAGSWLVKNHHLEELLDSKGMNTQEIWSDIITAKGSVQHLTFLTPHEKAVFKTAIELDQVWIIQHAADRQNFICQGQSVNLFFPPNANRSYISKVHKDAWRKGLKSLYYTRTMTPFTVPAISNKQTRVALKDGDTFEVIEMKQTVITKSEITTTIISHVDESEADCISCQG